MLRIETYENREAFAPGQAVDGLAAWEFEEGQAPAWIEVRLFWRTQGKGDTDAVIVAAQRFDQPDHADAQLYSLTLPAGPFSYVGEKLEVRWALELVAHRVKRSERLDLTVSPTGNPVRG